jgi:thiamine-monophosphate kinase
LDLAERLGGQGVVHAATDISDGLALDLHHIATASRIGATIELDKIPVSEAALELSKTTGRPPVHHALGDGEDFELLLAIPKEKMPVLEALGDSSQFSIVGEFTPRTGLWSKIGHKLQQLPPLGYSHS